MEKISAPVIFDAVVGFVFENYGKLPAQIKELRSELKWSKISELPVVNFENIPPTINYSTIVPSESRRNDNNILGIEARKSINLDANTVNEIVTGNKDHPPYAFSLVGLVIYDDILGYRYICRFCIKLVPSDGNLLQVIHGGVAYNSISRKKIPESGR